PTNATWTELSFDEPSQGDYTWADATVDLSSITGSTVYLAFQYNYNNGSYRTWEVDDVSIENVTNPELTVNPEALSSLSYGEGNGPSGATSFALSALNLDGSDVSVTAPANFEIAESETGTYSNSITLTAYDGTETTVWVRLEAGLAQSAYSGDVTISGGGASDVTVAVSGEVTYPWDVVDSFTNFTVTGGSYEDGDFVGEAGNTWTYVNARGDGNITGPTPGLQNNSEAILSSTISDGIAKFSFDYMQMFSTDVNLRGFINGDSVTTVTSSDE
ncbi:MAG TPA: hypothetical protein DD671_07755, partial [Balneolaceae bacterium]|nr:hypothetical protein [Balneolaceae bacterium]